MKSGRTMKHKLSKETILYVGGFELPDRNAAAQRVIGLAKGFRALGHDVIFLNESRSADKAGWLDYFGFTCYERKKRSQFLRLTSIDDVRMVAEKIHATSIIAYNYPAIALMKLLRYCKKHGIHCYADATEWYVPTGNLLFRIIKTADTELRMRYLHPKMDGVIAISDYLYRYYQDKVKTVKIPPTVDISDRKWEKHTKDPSNAEKTLVYAGQPSAQKELLGLIVDAVEQAAADHNIRLIVAGLTQDQYETIYRKAYQGSHVTFLGRIDHEEAICAVTKADWSIIIRENNKVVQAGFPTKVAESISCGTPVIANSFSNIGEYLDEGNWIVCEEHALTEAIYRACICEKKVDRNLFDYRNYLQELSELLCLP